MLYEEIRYPFVNQDEDVEEMPETEGTEEETSVGGDDEGETEEEM